MKDAYAAEKIDRTASAYRQTPPAFFSTREAIYPIPALHFRLSLKNHSKCVAKIWQNDIPSALTSSVTLPIHATRRKQSAYLFACAR